MKLTEEARQNKSTRNNFTIASSPSQRSSTYNRNNTANNNNITDNDTNTNSNDSSHLHQLFPVDPLTTPVKIEVEEQRPTTPTANTTTIPCLTSPTGAFFEGTCAFRIVKSGDESRGKQRVSTSKHNFESPSISTNRNTSKGISKNDTISAVDESVVNKSNIAEEQHRSHVMSSLARAKNASTSRTFYQQPHSSLNTSKQSEPNAVTTTDSNLITTTKPKPVKITEPNPVTTSEDYDSDATEVSEMTNEELNLDELSLDGKEFVFNTSSIKPKNTRKRKYNNNSKTKNGVVQMKQEPPATPTKKTKTKTGNSKKKNSNNNNKFKETLSKSMNIRNYFGKVPSNQPLSPASKSAIDFTDKTDSNCLRTTAGSSNTSKITSKQNDRNCAINTSHDYDTRVKDTIKNVSNNIKPLTTLVEDSSSTESESENDEDTTLIESRGLGHCSPISSIQESPLKQFQTPLLNSTEIGDTGTGSREYHHHRLFHPTGKPGDRVDKDQSSCSRNNDGESTLLNHETSLVTGTRPLSLSFNETKRSGLSRNSKNNINVNKSRNNNNNNNNNNSSSNNTNETTSKYFTGTNTNGLSSPSMLTSPMSNRNKSKINSHNNKNKTILPGDDIGENLDDDYQLFPSSGQTVDISLENCIDNLVDLVSDEHTSMITNIDGDDGTIRTDCGMNRGDDSNHFSDLENFAGTNIKNSCNNKNVNSELSGYSKNFDNKINKSKMSGNSNNNSGNRPSGLFRSNTGGTKRSIGDSKDSRNRLNDGLKNQVGKNSGNFNDSDNGLNDVLKSRVSKSSGNPRDVCNRTNELLRGQVSKSSENPNDSGNRTNNRLIGSQGVGNKSFVIIDSDTETEDDANDCDVGDVIDGQRGHDDDDDDDVVPLPPCGDFTFSESQIF